MIARAWLRVGLAFLTIAQGAAGVVQLLLPHVFYADFPIPSHPWVSMLPPYNEHLMRDVGASTLAYVLVLAVATVTMNRLMINTALAANLMFTVPHLIFHATHLAGMAPGDAIAQTALIAFSVALPAVLLMVSARSSTAPHTVPSGIREPVH